MKTKFLLIMLFIVCTISGYCQQSPKEYLEISVDDLIAKADQYENKNVEVIGLIVHMCGVDGKKMKLKSPSGAILKIVPNDPEESFDPAFKKQLVCVQGLVEITRIEKAYVDKMEKEGTLLCHIDHTPCKDKLWVNNKIESGEDIAIVKKDIVNLREQLQEKDDINFVTIRSVKVKLLDE
ncbi:hypothetical protein BZG01_19065 [Labilibaculum manganireducens]|uniref:Uncharacterized protein n=1 Tax=Labilibaculum manganireducens TaxID=1940525 RepID=A0A2N3HUB5_9BACT|nr:hypothetical protein [Labilibaculum manganireducens]PKQ61643.1 hypothetical protein BZG01_19065 [Labilibaculum manganireducens]